MLHQKQMETLEQRFVVWCLLLGGEKKTNKKCLPADAWTRDCRGKSRGQETGGVTSVSPQARAGGGWDWGGGWDRGWWPLRQREEKKQLKRQDKKTHCQ